MGMCFSLKFMYGTFVDWKALNTQDYWPSRNELHMFYAWFQTISLVCMFSQVAVELQVDPPSSLSSPGRTSASDWSGENALITISEDL